MYCPHCGAGSAAGLRYCKHCGGNLAVTGKEGDAAPPQSRITGAAWAVAMATTAICLIGLGIVFSFAFDMTRPWGNSGVPGEAGKMAIFMVICGSATVLGVIALLIRLFTRIIAPSHDASRAKGQVAQPPAPPVIDQYPAQLPAPPVAMPSVTEHTTRNFEPPPFRAPGARE